MTLTDRSTVTGGPRSELGYWELGIGPGEPHLARTEALPGLALPGLALPGSVVPGGGPAAGARPLLTIAHLSDLHLCDTQSPARGEFLDRWSDPDSPLREALGIIGSYRAQDCLTVPVGVAMVDAVNRVAAGPVGGAPVDVAIVTGDVIDSAQANELGWYLTLLDGGTIVPDSGSASRYEGVADLDFWHEAFWHPDVAVHADGTARRDRPGALFGFPPAPGLLDAARRPCRSPGLSVPWLAVHGNHDQLVQGSILALGPFAEASMSDRKAIDVPGHWSLEQIAQFCGAADSTEQISLDRWGEMVTRAITPDPARRIITRGEFVAAHFAGPARPFGHGFRTADAADAYYRHDYDQVTVLVLDTVNEHGGWQGSLDEPQASWLEAELRAADSERRYVVLASHHTLADLVNDRSVPGAPRRILTAETAEIVDAHPSVLLWLNGHTHITRVTPHSGHHSWWEVTTPSLIDFPQQSRVVEILQGRGLVTVAVTMVDHSGETPWTGEIDSTASLAGLSRQLAANDWQLRPDVFSRHPRMGTASDRNVLLDLTDPWA